MFTPQGPTLRELAVQALSSVEHGYDLLAPKFDQTPFRTPDVILDPVTRALRELGPYRTGLDLCCGTGAGLGVLREVCADRAVGVDFSAGMLEVARRSEPTASYVRADALALPFGPVFDLVVSFGAFGHFLPRQQRELFAQVRQVLSPGGQFVFPLPAPARPGSRGYWAMLGFDTVMRVRNAVWRPPFVMYYRVFRLGNVRRELEQAGFDMTLRALPELGERPDGSPRCGLVVATRR
ncbi:methyltransferase domain-containing protein [Streptomyces sp. SID8379]|uniref:class I SAM-dependent methyltransferase n=1 Tax=unclassified Streptomyces TaxID=2593676 RepID=UPI00035F26A0|nr:MULTISPECIES: class I SAM-dependent methyltransferase [unclassified Streptomyces]MYW64391.1 methyltransferase domain-containing protein [Streptomyces sp. SID8379]